TLLRRTSGAPELLRQPPTRPYTRARLHSSRSLQTKRQRLQHTSRAPELHTSMPPARPYTRARLQSSIPLHLRACSLSPYLRTSASRFFHLSNLRGAA